MMFRVCAFSDRETTVGQSKLLSRAAQQARAFANREDRRYVVLNETGCVVFCAIPGSHESILSWQFRQKTGG